MPNTKKKMENQNNQSDHAQFPEIILSVIGEQNIEQDYPNLTIKRLPLDKSFSQTFNKAKEIVNESMFYGYLLPHHNFTRPDALKIIVNSMCKYKKIFGVYADSRDHNGITQFYPSYNPSNVLDNCIVVNTPLFAKQPLEFNEKIEHLIFFDILRSTCRQVLWCHQPSTLIQLQAFNINPIKDLELIQQQ